MYEADSAVAAADGDFVAIADFTHNLPIGVEQLLIADPLMWTVQAPQRPVPHPNFVPVSCSESRRYQSRGISGSPSNW